MAAGGSAQRLRLAKVDDVEPVRLAHLGAGGAEIVPLRVAARAVIPVKQQVVLVTVDMHNDVCDFFLLHDAYGTVCEYGHGPKK